MGSGSFECWSGRVRLSFSLRILNKTMKRTLYALTAAFLTLSTLSQTVRAQVDSAPVMEATAISREDAMKKYPPPRGGYPVAEMNTTAESTAGIYKSPYSSRRFDCRQIKKNQLVLDPFAKKVFALP